jgi:hypothetical protein
VYLEIGLNLKCMTNKITLYDLKMAEHLLEENCVKIVEFFFRLNIKGNIIRTLYSSSDENFSQNEVYRIGPIPLLKKIDCLYIVDWYM